MFFVNSLSSPPSISFLLPDPTTQNVFLAALFLRRSSPLHTPRQTQYQVQHCHEIIRALGSGRHQFAQNIEKRITIHSRCMLLLTARCAKVDYATTACWRSIPHTETVTGSIAGYERLTNTCQELLQQATTDLASAQKARLVPLSPPAHITANAHRCCRKTSTFIFNQLSTRCVIASRHFSSDSMQFTLLLLQLPTWEELGLVLLDPAEQLNVKDKSLKDMGQENFDLSEFERIVKQFTSCFVMFARRHLS
jgi:hypothetical protein